MADSTLNILIKLRNTAVAGLNRLKKSLKGAAGAADDLSDSDVEKLEDGVEDLNEEVAKTATATQRAAFEFNELKDAALAIAAIGASIAAPFLAAAKAAGEFQTQIAEIETLVGPTAGANAELRDSVISLSNEFGVDRAKVASALYQTISTGAKAGAEANEQLAVALTLARGGVADVESVTKGLSSVLNAFGLASSEAGAVADSFFTTVKGGATTIDELSGFLFQAAPLANALSVEFTELNAAIQTITLSGTPTAQATTQIRAALQGLARDTPEVNDALGEFGSVSEAISKIGLQATFDKIRKASKGSTSELIKLIGSIEGVQAVLQLTGENSLAFTAALKQQDEAAGAAAAAAAIMEQSFGVQLETAITRVSNAFTELGEAVIPVLEPIVVGVGNLAVAFQQLLASNELVQLFAQIALGVIALTAAFAGLLGSVLVLNKGLRFVGILLTNFGRGLRLFTIQVARASGAVKVLTIGLRAMLGPVGFVITTLLLLIPTASAFGDTMEEVNETLDTSIENFAALSEIDKIRALDIAKEALIELRKEAKAASDQLDLVIRRNDPNRGTFTQNLIQTDADEEEARKVSGDLAQQVADLEEKIKVLEGKSEINLANVDVSDTGIAKIISELEIASNRALAFQANLNAAVEEANAFVPESTKEFGGGRGEITTKAEPEGFKTATEQFDIDNIQEALDLENEVIRRLNARLKVIQDAKFAQGKANSDNEKAAAAELSSAEKLAALKTSVSITSAEGRLAETKFKAQADFVRAESEALTADLERQLDTRAINEEEFAAERTKIILGQLASDQELAALQLENARKLADAKIAVIEAGIDRETLAKDAASGSETSTSSAAAIALVDSQIQILNLAFDTTEATIEGRLARLGVRTKAQIAAIAADIAGGTVEGITKAFDSLLAQQAQQTIAIQAQLEAGAITQTEAQRKLAVSAQLTADVIESDLIPAVEALLLIDPENEGLLALLVRFQTQLELTGSSLTEFELGLQNIFESELANFLEDLLNGFDNLAEAADKFIQGVRSAVLRLIAEKLANKLITSLFGSILTPGGGGKVPSPAGGGFIQAADGGTVQAATGGVVRKAVRNRSNFVKAAGGGVLKLAGGSGPTGGAIRGPGTSTSDSIPAMLSDGEYVIKAKSVRQYGLQMLESINQGVAPPVDVVRRLSITKPPMRRFAEGGPVGSGSSKTGAPGQQSERPTELVLNVSDEALNLTMRDFLEQEFGRIMSTR